MKIFIDNNFWDYLVDNNLSLESYFPKVRFSLYITTHGKYEIVQMPERCSTVKEYAQRNLHSGMVKEDAVFGFHSDLFPEEYQRSSGFGKGRFSTTEEQAILRKLLEKYGTIEKRHDTQILFKQEADIQIAARSMFHPIITFDAKKKGALNYMSKNGGKVVFLSRKESESISPSKFMRNLLRRIDVYKSVT
ncbi:hypothetical protein [Psychromonas sp. Urea-02u-13]|uniref:hypothetical protein n=1 Tax=Psychromonas sp. Urea-02u-13 TaxID=2058326 RepID=UPI000C342B50|nr:hypothetical protein [Psychromonas sp. Urea-02u-13]PKG39750.1 hypothetical protein CXF74_06750 [Psychromonas sp. Urea-02u-13]